jgi:thioredoxin reductase
MEDVMKSIHAARYTTQLSSKVTIYTTDNKKLGDSFATSLGNAEELFVVDDRKIARFFKPEASAGKAPTAEGIEFADDNKVEESFIGHYPLSKAKGPFQEQLGLPLLISGDIVTNAPWLQTDIRGVFACGDNSQPRKIIPEAQNTGSLVGAAVSNQIIAERFEQAGLV